ncbi:MAG: ABC transporter ATP-binding protein [Rhodocyclaceae bacterium]|nr:ABC transporter ATP-binding protein [Rhodocyclaceae bacterium]
MPPPLDGKAPIAIQADRLGKVYRLYERPIDRLKQFLYRGRKNFGREFWALREVSFALRKGETLGVVGRNGAGKSTLLQIVCGTVQPSSGTIMTNGRVAALLELGAGFNPEFTGRENVFLNAALLGVSEDEASARFDEIVDFAGLGDFIDQPVKTYSSGMYVRLAFAIATAFEPEILVIDEALSVGDGAFARKSFERIMHLKDKGATILFCSHAMYHIDALCERALWLERGEARMLDAAPKVTAAYGEFLAKENPPPKQEAGLFASKAAAGTARILDVQGYSEGVAGRELPVVSRVSTVSITVEFASDPSLPCPTVALGLETDAGVGIASTIAEAERGEVWRDADGRGQATVTFPAIPLLKGRYRVNAYLACEKALHLYDSALRCLTLDVSQHDALQGVVALPNTWRKRHDG